MEIVQPNEQGAALPSLIDVDALVADAAGGLAAGDPRLAAAIAGASAAIRRFCRWHVAPMIRETLVLDGTGGKVLHLPSLRVEAVEALRIGGINVPTDQYAWSASGLIELHGKELGTWRTFPRLYRSVEVTLVHGYHEAPDLAAVASQIARFALASPMGVTREQAGQMSVSWGTTQGMSFSESALAMMKPYRLQIQP